MARRAFHELLFHLAALPPEAGGILLGPIGSNDVTDFVLDDSGGRTGATYTPDHVTLNRLMKEKWMPSGRDMKGFAHSHPGNYDSLSPGDLAYISRLLAKNDDMDLFVAPIVIPHSFRVVPFVVLRSNPSQPRLGQVVFF